MSIGYICNDLIVDRPKQHRRRRIRLHRARIRRAHMMVHRWLCKTRQRHNVVVFAAQCQGKILGVIYRGTATQYVWHGAAPWHPVSWSERPDLLSTDDLWTDATTP